MIDTDDCVRFKKIIFRVTRGNSLVVFGDLNAAVGEEIELDKRRSIYVVLYREGEAIKTKITKVCDSFSRERFEMSETDSKERDISSKSEETKKLLTATKSERMKALLSTVVDLPDTHISKLELQKWYITREKELYVTLNKLEVKNSLLRGLCWCPMRDVPGLMALFEGQNSKKSHAVTFKKIDSHTLTPPTYLRVSEFTFPFQEIVSTYGIPSYQEVNPAFFTTVTFPFLFGVMFGDVCHGLVLTCIAVMLCLNKDTLIKSKSMFASMIKVRYLLLLMGVFATFCGLLYNDFAGLNLNLFTSCYHAVRNPEDDSVDVVAKENCVYPLGFDPYWGSSKKQLQFENSFKMKLSVILGVLHMTLGVVMKYVNARFFKNSLDVFFEFLPQAVFLLALFGYMDGLIILKWLTKYEDTHDAPVITTGIINMFIGIGKPDKMAYVFDAQPSFSIFILILIVLCIPTMLLPKPFILKKRFESQTSLEDRPTTSLEGAINRDKAEQLV